MKDQHFDVVLTKARRFCAYQERCIHELKLKNKTWGLNQDDFNTLIARLQENNFLDEKRYVEMYVHGKFHQKQWGKLKIKQKLYAREIDDKAIEKGLSIISDKEYEACIKGLLQIKVNTLDNNEPNKKAKLFKFMQSKGFETELFYGLIAKYE